MASDPLPDTALEVPHTYLRACISLALAEQSGYGYELSLDLPALGAPHARVHTGTTYRALRELERDGLVLSHWDHSQAGRPRRVYSITTEGREWLDQAAQSVEEMRRGYSRFLHRHRQLTHNSKDQHTRTSTRWHPDRR